MSEFRQIISNGQKRIGFLIGAGAPMNIRVNFSEENSAGDPLIPDVKALTSQVLELVKPKHEEICRLLMAEINSDLAVKTPPGEANIELLLSKVRLLSNAIGRSKVYNYDGSEYAMLASDICNAIGTIVDRNLPEGESCYTRYVAWISGTARTNPIETFTTNYDLLLEEAFERHSVAYFDGFSGSREPFFDATTISSNNLPSSWARLWKLHGSLGWELKNDKVVRTGGVASNAMIFPEAQKYDRVQKMPFTAFFERFKNFMRQSDTLLITSGFSFADAHISSVIDEALAENPSLSIFAFSFGPLEKAHPALIEIAQRRSNLSVYADHSAIVNCTTGDWRLGDVINKEWPEIRQSFWKAESGVDTAKFTLGSFDSLCKFLVNAKSERLVAEHAQLPFEDTLEILSEQKS